MEEIKIKTPEQIAGIRKSSQLASSTLDFIAEHVKPGVTTNRLDELMDEFIQDNKAISACKGYKVGDNIYPKSTCISLNEVVCHGIPSDRKLKEGDILNIDVTTILNGYYGDTSRMFTVPPISKSAQSLINCCKKALELGIKAVKPGNNFGLIGHEIACYAIPNGFSVVDSFCGHGVGLEFHEPPLILHIDVPSRGPKMKPGMIFTIEPMINIGSHKVLINEQDGWTAVTEDGELSAQWEHTILVTETGHEILSQSFMKEKR